MLENIKSLYFLKYFFMNLCELNKLKLTKYNKSLQKKLDLNISNYMFFSRRYIIYEKKGRGKEYDWYFDLVYDGEYLNGERNGKGKEYSTYGELVFEGEYYNGKKWNGKGYKLNGEIAYVMKNGKGYVKEYNAHGRLLFEGEYVNGKRNGKGKEYNRFNFCLEYEGEYLYGIRNGKGKQYNRYEILEFEGEFFNGKIWSGKVYDTQNTNNVYEMKNGKGFIKEYDVENYLIFENEYLNGEKNGKGKIYSDIHKDKILIFEGEYLNNKKWSGKGYNREGEFLYELKDGKGKILEDYYNGKIYVGNYLNGEKNGKGEEYNYDGILIFEGEYLNGKKNGKGKEFDTNGEILFEGEYKNDRRWKWYERKYEVKKEYNLFEGEFINHFKRKGRQYIKGKLTYEGEFLCNRKWNGKEYDEHGNILYQIINGNGKAREYKYDDLVFEGGYVNGLRNGKGKEFDLYNHHIIFEGEYLNGKRKKI